MVDHFRLVHEVDISYPTILNVDGRVMDGELVKGRVVIDRNRIFERY
jgi:hypothetical protein